MKQSCREKLISSGMAVVATLILTVSTPLLAEVEWAMVTLDNDTFVGNDNGYTNGLSYAWFDGPLGKEKAEPGFLSKLMLWSLPDSATTAPGFSVKRIGQSMVTPNDITQDPPILPPDDLPYGGLLFYTDNWISLQQDYADKVSVSLGVVGEYSFAEETQDFVHQIIDSDDPCCWDQQLDNEVVFEISRGRVWKAWASADGDSDLLLNADLQLGTIGNSIGAGFMIRYGDGLKRSYATTLLTASRTINPVVTRNGWYLFAGARASYLDNLIFLDGSKSYGSDFDEIEYKGEAVSISAGLAYSWDEVSFTFAVNDLNINENSDNESAEQYSRYGTFTIAWKLD